MRTLVTRLQSSVDNDNLSYLNAIRVILPSGDLSYSVHVEMYDSVKPTFVILNDNPNIYITNNNSDNLGKEWTPTIWNFDSNLKIKNSTSENVTILIKNKYQLKKISATNYTGFKSEDLLGTNIAYLKGNYINGTFNLSDLSDCPIVSISMQNGAIQGDISVLGNWTGLTNCDMRYPTKNITGTVESIVEGQWGKGRRSGTISDLYLSGCSVHLNGANVGSKHLTITFGASNVVITNSVDETTATYNGSSWSYT